MPHFEPFPGLRYRDDVDLDAVTAPPYDVISPAARAELAARTAYNVVHVDLPDEAAGPDRYTDAAERLAQWEADGVLVRDGEPSFYVYRMGYRDREGRPRQTTGVIGALGLVPPFDGVLPHERTTPDASLIPSLPPKRSRAARRVSLRNSVATTAGGGGWRRPTRARTLDRSA